MLNWYLLPGEGNGTPLQYSCLENPMDGEVGRLQSMGSLGVGHDRATSLSLSCIGEGNGNPLQYSCLENPMDGGAWWAAVYGVAQSRTRLKQLSSSLAAPWGRKSGRCNVPPSVGRPEGSSSWEREEVSPVVKKAP